jgi:hypothetical protein
VSLSFKATGVPYSFLLRLRRLPRHCRRRERFTLLRTLASKFRVAEAPAKDANCGFQESSRVIVFALVEAKRLFIQILDQVERLDVHVSSFQRPFEQTPKIL